MTPRERFITREQVMHYEGKSERWVKLNAPHLGRRDGPVGPNGHAIPLYDACRMSAGAQRRWLEERERAKHSKVVEITAPAAGQLALGLSTADPAALELSARQLEEAEGRLGVIRPALRHPEGSAARKEALQAAARASGKGWSTLYRWVRRYEGTELPGRQGLEALVDRSRKDKGRSRKLTPAAKDLMVRMLTPGGDLGNLTVKQAWQEYVSERAWRRLKAGQALTEREASLRRPYVEVGGDGPEGQSPLSWRLREDAQLPELSYSTFRNFAREIPEPLKVLTRKGPDAFEKTQLPTSHRDYELLSPLDLVVMDHRELDLLCVLPPSKRGGEPRVGRPWITAAMDMRTRRWLGWHISDGGDSWTIVSVLKTVLTKFGRPEAWYWDNGQDFDSHWLQQIVEAVGTKVTHALPYNARAKSIEPNFRRMASWERSLPEWVGNKTEARPERTEQMAAHWRKTGEGLRPLHEVRGLYDDKLLLLNRSPLAGQGMTEADATGMQRPRTPLEVWDELMATRSLERVRPVDLAFLFRLRKRAKVRQGEVTLQRHGRTFHYRPMAPEYDPFSLVALNGKTVELAIDRYDLGVAPLYLDGRLVCVVENAALRSMSDESFQADMAARRRVTKAHRELVAAVIERVGVMDPVERMREQAAAARAEEAARGERGREVTVLYPEAERARVAVNGGGPVNPRPLRVFRPEDEGDSKFDFFE